MTEPADDFAAAWQGAGSPIRRSLELAYASLVNGGLACGAVLTDADGRIVAEGRNRAYDPPGGPDRLQGSPLAHAETNVLASVPTARDLASDTLWTTQEPCSMCTAAAAFTGVGTVRYLAPDPWALSTGVSRSGVDHDEPSGLAVIGPLEDARWVVVSNVLFLLSIARSRGLDHPTIRRNGELDPDTAAIVVALAAGDDADARGLPATIEAFTDAIWTSVVAAAREREARRL